MLYALMNMLLCQIFAVSMVRGTRKKASTIVDTSGKPLWKKWEDGELNMPNNYMSVDEDVEDLTAVPKNGYFTKKADGTESLDIPQSAHFELRLNCPKEFNYDIRNNTIKWATSDDYDQTMWAFQSAKTNVLWEKAYEIDGFKKTTKVERVAYGKSHGYLSPAVLNCPLPVNLEIDMYPGLGSKEGLLGIYNFGSANITNLKYDLGPVNKDSDQGSRGTLAFEFEQNCGLAVRASSRGVLMSPYCSPQKKGLVVLSLKTMFSMDKIAVVRRVTLYTEK